MDKLISILKKHEVQDFEVATMMYHYLTKHTDCNENKELLDELYENYLRSDLFINFDK